MARSSIEANYCTMIELDRVGDRLDRNYLHGLSTAPFCVAGAIRGDHGPQSSRDAAAPFPPIGQGVNAAMESSMVLDLCIGETGASPGGLLEAARLYDARWKPEAHAVSWISERSLFENPYHAVRALVASMLGISVFDRAKSVELPYSEVRRRAEGLWPLRA